MMDAMGSEWGRTVIMVIVNALFMGFWWLIGDQYAWRVCIIFAIFCIGAQYLLARRPSKKRAQADLDFYQLRRNSWVLLYIGPIFCMVFSYIILTRLGFVESKWFIVGNLVLFSIIDWWRYYSIATGSRLKYPH